MNKRIFDSHSDLSSISNVTNTNKQNQNLTSPKLKERHFGGWSEQPELCFSERNGQ